MPRGAAGLGGRGRACMLVLAVVAATLAGCGANLDNFGPHDASPTPERRNTDSSLRWFADADSQLVAILMALSVRGGNGCEYSSDEGPDNTFVIRACLNRSDENDYVWIWDPGARKLEPVSESARELVE